MKAKKSKLSGAVKVAKQRAKEPSTWAGLGVIAGALGALFPVHAAALTAIATAAGGVAMMLGEGPGAGGQP